MTERAKKCNRWRRDPFEEKEERFDENTDMSSLHVFFSLFLSLVRAAATPDFLLSCMLTQSSRV